VRRPGILAGDGADARDCATSGGRRARHRRRLAGSLGYRHAPRSSSVAAASLVASQLAQTAVVSRGAPAVLAVAALSGAALVATVQTPIVSQFFGSRPLGPLGWGIVLDPATGAAAMGAVPVDHLHGLTRVVERVSTAGARLLHPFETKQ